MVLENHAECKTAILGLLDALARIKKLSQVSDKGVERERLAAIHQLANDAGERHAAILPRM